MPHFRATRGMQDNQLTTNQNEQGFRIAMSALR